MFFGYNFWTKHARWLIKGSKAGVYNLLLLPAALLLFIWIMAANEFKLHLKQNKFYLNKNYRLGNPVAITTSLN